MHTVRHPPIRANTTSAAMPDCRPVFRRFLLPLLLALAAVTAFSVDLPVAMRLRHWNAEASPQFNKDVHAYLGYFDNFEPLGHGLGVLFVLLALHQLDPARRWAIPRVAACALAGGGAADLLKMLIVRTRPNDLPLDFSGPVWATFKGWLPMLSGQSGSQGFPSAHTATAAGLAAALIWLYPQGRWLFTLLAVLVGCQRITSGAHFPSDVCAGAAAGLLAAMLLLYVGRAPGWFDHWESRWRGEK
jgi:membrane-associated phospholipid phosphatase